MFTKVRIYGFLIAKAMIPNWTPQHIERMLPWIANLQIQILEKALPLVPKTDVACGLEISLTLQRRKIYGNSLGNSRCDIFRYRLDS